MGLATAQALQALGYQVSGWTRSPTAASGQQQQERAGIACYAGQQQLRAFVAAQDVLVCLLPLTQETAGEHAGRRLVRRATGSAGCSAGVTCAATNRLRHPHQRATPQASSTASCCRGCGQARRLSTAAAAGTCWSQTCCTPWTAGR
jgi:hypothetical protein